MNIGTTSSQDIRKKRRGRCRPAGNAVLRFAIPIPVSLLDDPCRSGYSQMSRRGRFLTEDTMPRGYPSHIMSMAMGGLAGDVMGVFHRLGQNTVFINEPHNNTEDFVGVSPRGISRGLAQIRQLSAWGRKIPSPPSARITCQPAPTLWDNWGSTGAVASRAVVLENYLDSPEPGSDSNDGRIIPGLHKQRRRDRKRTRYTRATPGRTDDRRSYQHFARRMRHR